MAVRCWFSLAYSSSRNSFSLSESNLFTVHYPSSLMSCFFEGVSFFGEGLVVSEVDYLYFFGFSC